MKIKKILILTMSLVVLSTCFTACNKEENNKKTEIKTEKTKTQKTKPKKEAKIETNAFMVIHTTTKEKEEKIRTCMSFEEVKEFIKENKKILKTVKIQDVHIIGNDANYEDELDASGLFKDCENIKKIDLSTFKTKRVTRMNNMFTNCIQLEKIYISDKWDMSNVEKNKNMFKNCICLSGDKKFDARQISSKYATHEKGYLTYKEN